MGGIGGLLLLSMLGASITGVTIAMIAKVILPGAQHVSGIEMFLIGTGAAWLGGFIGGLFGWGEGRGLHWGVLIIQVALAAVAIWLWTDFRNKQIKQALTPDLPGKGDKDGNGGPMSPVGPTGKKDDDDKGGKGVPGVPGI